MKGAVRRERLNHSQFPDRLLWKWRIDSRRTLPRGTYSVVDVDIFKNECALDSRTLVLRFGCFVLLSSPPGISFVYWKIFKFAAWNLQNVIWSFIHCYSKTISCNIQWPYRKKKLRIKVQPIGLEWNKWGRARFPKLKITLVSKLCLLEW